MHDATPSTPARTRRFPAPGELADRYYHAHRDAIDTCLELRRTARIALAASDRFLAAFRLTDVAMAVLLELRRTPGATPAALAEHAGIRPSGAAMILQRLERQGWVERAPDPRDGRRRGARLTPSGRRELDLLLRDYYLITTAQLERLSPSDRTALRRLLGLVRSGSPPPPRRSRNEHGIDLDEPFHEWELWEDARRKRERRSGHGSDSA